MSDDNAWAEQFPRLFRDVYVEYADCWTSYTTVDVDVELVSRLHLVAVTPEGKVVVCRSAEGWRFLPGGRREPGESLRELASRELQEEAAATLDGEVRCFSAHVADSRRDQPHRPHFPHPRALWAYAVVNVRITDRPSNPVDGETVVDVLTLPPCQAAAYLEVEDPVHADVLRHAVAIGLLHRSVPPSP